MGFLVPLFAGFAVLAGVPIVVHLYGRPRAIRRRFAAMRFLLESDQKTAARRRLQEILLLVSRAIAIAAVPLILAKPFVETRSETVGGLGESESAVIVLDDSLSMELHPSGAISSIRGGTVFARAQARARRLVDSLGPDSEAALIVTSQGASAPQAELTADRAKLAQALAETKPGRRPGDTTAALKRASAILAASPRAVRRVFLVSDLAAHGFSTEAPWGAGGPELVPVDVGEAAGDKVPANRAVMELQVEPAPQLGPRGISVVAKVANHGDVALKDQALTLRIDGKAVATGLVDLPGRGRGEKRFFHAFGEADPAVAAAASPPRRQRAGAPQTGDDDDDDEGDQAAATSATRVHECVVELAPDALPDDDRRFVRLEERRSLKVLIIDGDPRTVRREDEVFYLETALRPGDRDDSRLEVRVTTLDDLTRRRLDDEDVIFVANVKAPDRDHAAALSDFVDKGGGLFLSVGDNADVDAWNTSFGDLLPQPLATLRTVGRTLRAREDGETSTASQSLVGDGERIARFDRGHPVLTPFEGPGAMGTAGAQETRGTANTPNTPNTQSAPNIHTTPIPPDNREPPRLGATAPASDFHGPAQGLREARVGRYALLRPTPNGGGSDDRRALLRLDSGAPLLVEGKKGAGRVLLLTTTIDRDWSDLAIQPAYLPLMQQAARYLARAPLSAPEPPSLVGQPREIALPDGATRVEVKVPSGTTRWFGEDKARGRNALHFTDTEEPGFYRVSIATGGGALHPHPEATFAVNVDTAESDLTRIDPKRLSALSQGPKSEGGKPPRRRLELWHTLGAVLLGLLLCEGILSMRKV